MIHRVHEDFSGPIHPELGLREEGQSRVELLGAGQGVRLILEQTNTRQLSNAQIDDYLHRAGPPFVWRPPARMTVRARASHPAGQLKGTAGFGFWTQPFMPGRRPRLPSAVWFFNCNPPSDLPFAYGVPGTGWKAANFDANRLPFLLLAPTAPLGVLAMRVPALYRLLWPVGQWAIGVSEKLLAVDLAEMHTYRVDWLRHETRFFVDDLPVHTAPYSPRGPLGFVAWMDNRHAVVTPQGRMEAAAYAFDGPQWLQIEFVTLERIDSGSRDY